MIGTDEKSISLTHIHDSSLSWLGTGTSIISGGVKQLLCKMSTFAYNW